MYRPIEGHNIPGSEAMAIVSHYLVAIEVCNLSVSWLTNEIAHLWTCVLKAYTKHP